MYSVLALFLLNVILGIFSKILSEMNLPKSCHFLAGPLLANIKAVVSFLSETFSLARFYERIFGNIFECNWFSVPFFQGQDIIIFGVYFLRNESGSLEYVVNVKPLLQSLHQIIIIITDRCCV